MQTTVLRLQTITLGAHLTANAVHLHSGLLTVLSCACEAVVSTWRRKRKFYVADDSTGSAFECKCSALALRCADIVVDGCKSVLRLQTTTMGVICMQMQCIGTQVC